MIRRSVALVTLLLSGLAATATAQADTTRPNVAVVERAVVRPPLSPRRAFVYSLLAPGSAQSILGRHRSAATLLTTEAIALLMIAESQANVREARRNLSAADTVIVSYVDGEGRPLGTPLRRPARFSDVDVRARRNHVEDWIAILVANHLFAGAEAFVAANLWDRPPQLSLGRTPAGRRLTLSLRW